MVLIDEIVSELNDAKAKFPPFNSYHEGYAVIFEEMDELWAEIKGNTAPEFVRKEAIQVAAMALRFLTDCFE